jgi:uncharacterized protein
MMTPSSPPPTAFGLTLLPSGAAWWENESTLVLADLHLEKGSSRAAQGIWLPPYDTVRTLDRIRVLMETHRPRRVLCLGDGFEDRHAWSRMEPDNQDTLKELTSRCEWTWIAGNHDPKAPDPLLGPFVPSVEIAGVTFRHQPTAGDGPRVFAHFHPKATLVLRGRRISGPCFLATERDLVLPAFGAYTGGLDRKDPALQATLRGPSRTWLLHQDRLFPVG